MSAKHKSNDRRTFIKVLALAAAIVAVVGLSVWWFFDYTKDDGLIYPNVYVFGENLGGMTPEAAAAAIHAQTDSTYSAENLIINLPDGMLALSPAQTRAQLDVDAMVSWFESYKGRSKTSCPNPSDWLEAFGDADEVYCVAITSRWSSRPTAMAGAETAGKIPRPAGLPRKAALNWT